MSTMIEDKEFEYKKPEEKTATESAELEDDTEVEYKLLVDEPDEIDEVQGLKHRFDLSNRRTLTFLVITAIEFWLINLVDSLPWIDSIKHSEQQASITGLFLISLAFWFDILVSLLWGFFVYKLTIGSKKSYKPRSMLWTAVAAEQLTLVQSYVWYVVMFSEGNYNNTAIASDAIQVALSIIVVVALLNDTNYTPRVEPSYCDFAAEV